MVEEKLVEVAFVNVWRAVQLLALPRLRPMVRAMAPVYVSEKVRVLSVAVRLARVPPRAIPEMVEFWSWLLPMVVVETRPPELFAATRVLAVREETARVVLVALVEVALSERRVLIVVEPVERNPPRKAMIVEVACSLVESLVKGKANVMEFR